VLVLCGLAERAVEAMGGWLARGERERDPLLRAWHWVGELYARLGLGRESYEPALEWARRVAAARPRAGQELVALSQRFADSRYAPGHGGLRQLVQDLRRHRP